MKEMILEMTSKRLGCVLMLNEQGGPGAVFTDGDLRRLVEKSGDFFKLKAADVMLTSPKTIPENALLDTALAMMEKHTITQLATVDKAGKLVGVIHLHDILKSKLV
jgi:arabinose-5-phosphate isomerase